jgi:hypothetical protein
MYYHEEIKYILDIIAVVLGKDRFDKFALFIDGYEHVFAELVAEKNEELNPNNYSSS